MPKTFSPVYPKTPHYWLEPLTPGYWYVKPSTQAEIEIVKIEENGDVSVTGIEYPLSIGEYWFLGPVPEFTKEKSNA